MAFPQISLCVGIVRQFLGYEGCKRQYGVVPVLILLYTSGCAVAHNYVISCNVNIKTRALKTALKISQYSI